MSTFSDVIQKGNTSMIATENKPTMADRLMAAAEVARVLELDGYREFRVMVGAITTVTLPLHEFRRLFAGEHVTVTHAAYCDTWEIERDGIKYCSDDYTVLREERPKTETVTL